MPNIKQLQQIPPAGLIPGEAGVLYMMKPDGTIVLVNSDNGLPITSAAAAYTASVSSLAADGSVAAGSRSVTFIFSSDFAGTIAGGAFAGATDASVDFVAPFGGTLGAIAVTVSAGTVRIAKVV